MSDDVTPTPPDAEAVARLDVMLAVTACEQSVSEPFTQEDYNRDRASLEAALDAYRAAVRADADAEVERLRELLEDFFDEDVEALRLHPDIPWGIGGKSGAERVAEWRKDLADRIERILAANRAAQDHHTTGGASDA